MYTPGAPDWLYTLVSPLQHLVYGRGYWIYATEATTLYLKGAEGDRLGPNSFSGYPPATYYGPVVVGDGFAPQAGMTVKALVNGVVCGQGQTIEVGGQVVYAVQVKAESWDQSTGCGVKGKRLLIEVNGKPMSPFLQWDNSQVWDVVLAPAIQVYLPVVRR